jgi:hypothetical protein
MGILNYRKTTIPENENANLKCSVMKANHMQCDRRVTRFVNNNNPLCEGHFQIMRQHAVADNETIIDQDESKEVVTGESKP